MISTSLLLYLLSAHSLANQQLSTVGYKYWYVCPDQKAIVNQKTCLFNVKPRVRINDYQSWICSPQRVTGCTLPWLVVELELLVCAVPLRLLDKVSPPHTSTQLSVCAPSDPGEKGRLGLDGRWCSSFWRCSRHSARRVWPRDRAMASGRRPRESGMARARRSHLYRRSAASTWPRAHAHIWKDNVNRSNQGLKLFFPTFFP